MSQLRERFCNIVDTNCSPIGEWVWHAGGELEDLQLGSNKKNSHWCITSKVHVPAVLVSLDTPEKNRKRPRVSPLPREYFYTEYPEEYDRRPGLEIMQETAYA